MNVGLIGRWVGPRFWKTLLLEHYAPCKHLTKGWSNLRRSSHSYVGQSLPGPVHSTILFPFAICVQKRIPKYLSIQSYLAFPYVWCCFLIPNTSWIFHTWYCVVAACLLENKPFYCLSKWNVGLKRTTVNPLRAPVYYLFIYVFIFLVGFSVFCMAFLISKEKKKPNNIAIHFTLT
jgi:hypothetical protein